MEIARHPQEIMMLAPFTPMLKEIQVKVLSMDALRLKVELCWKNYVSSTIVSLPQSA
jgi:hypothetical protein